MEICPDTPDYHFPHMTKEKITKEGRAYINQGSLFYRRYMLVFMNSDEKRKKRHNTTKTDLEKTIFL